MTEQIKSAISEIENMRKFNYTLAPNEVFDLAINSLKAWEEVLQELKNMREVIWRDTDDERRIVRANAWDKIIILVKAIDIIKQKLEGVKE